MGRESQIEWTDHTFNPWWGCSKVSAGCAHCYAETFSHRLGLDIWGAHADRRFFGGAHWNEPLKWDVAAKATFEGTGRRARVFCASMADVFEGRADLDPWRARLWELMAQTPCLDWLLLTKRPENIARMIPAAWHQRPPANWWMGTSTENQAAFDERYDDLAQCPARVKFLSVEPMLGPIDLDGKSTSELDWIIVGGESGPKARPMKEVWVQDLRHQAAFYQIHFFFKQWGGVSKKATGRMLDGGTWDEAPESVRL